MTVAVHVREKIVILPLVPPDLLLLNHPTLRMGFYHPPLSLYLTTTLHFPLPGH